MDTNKLISSLCYFSIFFAGFIFPIAVYFISDQHEVKEHAKSALLSHLIPLITIPIIVIFTISGSIISEGAVLGIGILMIIVFIGVNIGVAIWNIIKGIKVLKN